MMALTGSVTLQSQQGRDVTDLPPGGQRELLPVALPTLPGGQHPEHIWAPRVCQFCYIVEMTQASGGLYPKQNTMEIRQ